ncbi:MAG: hypothetical protein AB8G99_13105 [Planctomycetaceae bacterium]
MRNLIIALTCSLALGTVSVNLSNAAQKGKNQAQQSQKKQKKGGKGKSGQGKNPSTVAARMIQQHDRNGDKALNLQELTAALTEMQERRSQSRGSDKGGKGKGGAKGKGGKGKGGKGKGGKGKQ